MIQQKIFFGRVQSRKLSLEKKKILDKNYKNFLFHPEKLIKSKPIILEIGFGMGQNLIELAQKNPDKYIVGVDPFMNGVASVINTSVEKNIKNILLFPYPVQTFFEKFEKIIFEKVFMLFPDPWPKKKHHKRRLFRTEFVKTILKKISKQGKLYFATDNQNYYDEALIALHKENFKEMPIEIKKTDTKELILTKYFLRAKKLGNKVNFLVIVKL